MVPKAVGEATMTAAKIVLLDNTVRKKALQHASRAPQAGKVRCGAHVTGVVMDGVGE